MSVASKSDLELIRVIRAAFDADPLPSSAVDGLEGLTQAGTWQALVLEHGWIAYGGEFAPPGWRTEPGGLIRLRGMVKEGGPTEAIATLPERARPKYRRSLIVIDNTGPARVDILADGRVLPISVGVEFVDLDQLVFPVGG